MQSSSDILSENSKYIPNEGSVISTSSAAKAINASYNEGVEASIRLIETFDISCKTNKEFLIGRINKLKK